MTRSLRLLVPSLSIVIATCACVIAIFACATATCAWAGGDGSRRSKRPAAVHLGSPAPDVTGTIAPPPAVTPPPEDMTIPAPYTLPAASRERYRTCGATWRDMKLAGKTGDDDWREFAEKCLVQKDEASLPR